ncbi:MAG: sodium:solute symporter family protein [Bdellovibrionaceae bacterium]|nr:sodium:solute symporter family protein [Pseudobdellovibrionaceae bacterium]
MNYGIELSNQSAIIIGVVAVFYVIVITVFGGYFARFNKNINDFFYSGQRFSWWLPAASMIATGIGSYSYLKYSEQGFNSGMSSTMTYMNDWFILPFFIFGWLPIIYFSRIKSIPEYFERRFNRTARYISLVIIMAYMFFYIGYNLYTIGVAMEGMFGFPQMYSVPLLSIFLGAYVTFGGQTAVIFTDLFQGIMLYIAGGIAIFAGIYALGGLTEWWEWLPISHRLPLVHLTDNPKFNTAGLFWGEALAGSIAFTFMNQGFIMRYLTIKSVDEGRKAGFFNVLITLPLSAVIVGAVGWIGRSLINKQNALGHALEGYNFIEIDNTFHTFIIICWETVHQNPWIFGFIVAALMAALMSTIDTLINACAAIGIYDLYKPLVKPEATDEHYLKAARWASIITTVIGTLLVIWFNQQEGSLMSIHYKGIMIIIPSIVTTIFLGAFWRKFTPTAACVSMVMGSAITMITVWYPSVIDGLARFVSGPENGVYIYLRALFGMCVTGVIGIAISFITQPKKDEDIVGLTIDTIDESMKIYKGGEPNFELGEKILKLKVSLNETLSYNKIQLSPNNMNILKAKDGDLTYIADSRWFLGGLRSEHVKAFENKELKDDEILMSTPTKDSAYLLDGKTVDVEKIF